MQQREIEKTRLLCKFARALVKRFAPKILKCCKIIPEIYFEFIPWNDSFAFEKYFTIFINIGDVQQYLGELFYSDLAYIEIMSIVIHELFHMEQNVDQERYKKDKEYFDMVEKDVDEATDIFMSKYLRLFSEHLHLSEYGIALMYRLVENRFIPGFFTEPNFMIERFENLKDIYLYWFRGFLSIINFEKLANNWDKCNLISFSTRIVTNAKDENKIITTISPLVIIKRDDVVYYHSTIFNIFVDADGKFNDDSYTDYYSSVIIKDDEMDIYITKDLSSIERRVGFMVE